MNKKLALVALGLFSLSGAAQATLLDRGGGLIYDDALNVTWLQDASYGAGSAYDSTDGSTDGRMRWVNAMAWAANLSYYDSVRNATYDDWRLPTAAPVDGSTIMNYSGSFDGSTDYGHNISAPGSVYVGSKGSEMAYLFYNELGNKSYCPVSTIYACSPAPQPGWGLVNTGPFINFQGGAYWSSNGYLGGADAAVFFIFGSDSQTGIWDSDVGAQYVFSRDSRIYALAVRDGDVAAVPEPETYAMMLAGLGLVGFMARRKKKTEA